MHTDRTLKEKADLKISQGTRSPYKKGAQNLKDGRMLPKDSWRLQKKAIFSANGGILWVNLNL